LEKPSAGIEQRPFLKVARFIMKRTVSLSLLGTASSVNQSISHVNANVDQYMAANNKTHAKHELARSNRFLDRNPSSFNMFIRVHMLKNTHAQKFTKTTPLDRSSHAQHESMINLT
jgi:hypothetical protein